MKEVPLLAGDGAFQYTKILFMQVNLHIARKKIFM